MGGRRCEKYQSLEISFGGYNIIKYTYRLFLKYFRIGGTVKVWIVTIITELQ